MGRGAVWVLRASALWALWVWAILVRNMLTDQSHTMSFRVVHIALAVVSVAFAAATLVIAQRLRRALRTTASGPPEPGVQVTAPEQ
ncbi:MAG: hypothetical protein WCI12_04540 [Actinomycetes bacterium]